MYDAGKKMKGVDNAPEFVLLQGVDPASGGFGPSEGEMDANTVLSCDLWPGGDRAVVGTLPVEWANAFDDEVDPPPPFTRVAISFDAADLADLDAGRLIGLVKAAIDGSPKLAAEFQFTLESGPGEKVERVVYHTFEQLKDECPTVDRLVMNPDDETQFNDVAAEAREWIDGKILDKAASSCGYGHYGPWSRSTSPYKTALAADGLDLTTVGGLRISNASVFMTLAILLRRAVWVTNAPEGLQGLAADYEDRAMKALNSATADFAAEYNLAPVRFGGMHAGRLTR